MKTEGVMKITTTYFPPQFEWVKTASNKSISANIPLYNFCENLPKLVIYLLYRWFISNIAIVTYSNYSRYMKLIKLVLFFLKCFFGEPTNITGAPSNPSRLLPLLHLSSPLRGTLLLSSALHRCRGASGSNRATQIHGKNLLVSVVELFINISSSSYFMSFHFRFCCLYGFITLYLKDLSAFTHPEESPET